VSTDRKLSVSPDRASQILRYLLTHPTRSDAQIAEATRSDTETVAAIRRSHHETFTPMALPWTIAK